MLRFVPTAVVVVSLACAGVSRGDIIVSYDFDGAANPDLAADNAFPGVGTTALTKGPGGTFAAEPGYTSQVVRVNPTDSTDNTLADAIADGDYAGFSVTFPAGQTWDLTSLTYQAARGGPSTPRTIYALSSLGGFAAANVIETNAVTSTRATLSSYTVELTAPLYQDLTDQTVEFRLYYSTPGTGSSIEIDNVVLNGTVPEPGSLALLGVGALGLLRRRGRR